MICYTCRAPLTKRLYWHSPNAPEPSGDDSMFSTVPGPRPVCPPCAESLDRLDSKGKWLLRKTHAEDDGRVIPGSALPPSAKTAMMGA